MKIRISKSLYHNWPKSVVNRIMGIATDYNIKSFNFEQVEPSKLFYVGEGDRFWGLDMNGKEAGFEAVANHNVGAANVTHKIGAEFSMPAGSYLIQVYYYDKFYMSVYIIAARNLESHLNLQLNDGKN